MNRRRVQGAVIKQKCLTRARAADREHARKREGKRKGREGGARSRSGRSHERLVRHSSLLRDKINTDVIA